MAPVKRDTISGFNRDTVWLAVGVLGTVVFAALVLAVQECQPKAPQTEKDLSLNANPGGARSVLASSNFTGKRTPEQGSGDDHTVTETALLEPPSSSAAPTPAPVLAVTPEISRNAHRQDSAPERRPRSRNAGNRSSLASRTIDVKRRLTELWHESLARNAKSRSWTAFSNLNKGATKKAAYTAETDH
jgi:hypothetical protein